MYGNAVTAYGNLSALRFLSQNDNRNKQGLLHLTRNYGFFWYLDHYERENKNAMRNVNDFIVIETRMESHTINAELIIP